MPVNVENYQTVTQELAINHVHLVAVSKIQSIEDIRSMYDLGQQDFGENYVQELVEKQQALPADINWHFIGHLQKNKVKYIASFIDLIHGVDSLGLLEEINKQAKKNNRIIDCLLQVHIASEETKFGMNEEELAAAIHSITNNASYTHIRIKGLMGMASFSDDLDKVRSEMKQLKSYFDKYTPLSTTNCQFSVLSMGMSGDYKIAIEEGSNMVRIGSLLFGARPAK